MISLSFHSWDMLTPKKFIGVQNYVRLTQDRLLGEAVLNTFSYMLMYVPTLVIISLFVAILVNRKLPGMKLFRAAYFLPNVTSVAVLSLIAWRFLSPRKDGPLNYILGLAGIPPQEWLVSLKLALPSIAGLGLWQTFGYYMMLWLAGLQAVPSDLYDAAMVDGASGWKLHWYITIPLLRPTAAFIVLISTMGALQIFGSVYILTGGGPIRKTTTIAYHIYIRAFTFSELGFASTISILLFALILIITYVQSRYLRFGEDIF
jgi:ABC-type sugar transport system permease subunit